MPIREEVEVGVEGVGGRKILIAPEGSFWRVMVVPGFRERGAWVWMWRFPRGEEMMNP